ncbi:MAG: hypothetical protein WCP06_04925 [Verrucomicrobiota bacterium]
MLANYIVPTLQASVVCEDVRQEVNGMHSLVGVLSVIPAANVPVGLLKLCIWTRWCNGLGKFKQNARILAPDNTTVVAEVGVDFELLNSEAQATNVNFFAGIQFSEFGIYHIELLLDEKAVIRYPLVVAQAMQQPKPEAAPES